MKLTKFLSGSLSIAVALTAIMPSIQVKAAGSVHANANDDTISLGNDYISREYTIKDSHVLTSLLENKRANTTLAPQAGSEDFIINLLADADTPDTKPEIENKQEYVYTGLDSKLAMDSWNATLKNSNGDAFDDANVKKLFDNDTNTNVDNYQISGMPFTLEIDFGEKKTISSMSVNKRPGYPDELYGINGTMGGYEIWVKADDSAEYTKVKEGAFSAEDYNLHKEGTLFNVGDMVYVNLDQPVEAQQVKVVQTSVAFGAAEEFSSSEVNFYTDKIEKALKIVEPKTALERSAWNVSIQNKDGAKFDETNTAKVIDGDLNTYPDEYTKPGNPITVEIDLGSVQTVSSLSIDKRPGYPDKNLGTNGTMGEFEVYVSNDKVDWTIAGAGNFTEEAYNLHQVDNLYNVGDRVYLNLLKAYDTQYVRLVQKSCSIGSTAEFTSAELNLYSDAYQGYDWSEEVHGQAISSAIQSSKLIYKDTVISDTEAGGKKVVISYEPVEKAGVTYTIDQVAVLESEDHYMHSFIEIKASDNAKAQIDYIDQDHFVLPADAKDVWSHPEDSKISSMWIKQHELMLGQPIYANGFFMGSEFPATDTIVKNNETQIRYYSGKTFEKMAADGQLTTDGKFVSWQNVIGAARDTSESVVQTDFFDYIEDIATPTDFRKQYNSWYDNMMSITDESIASSFNGAEAGLSAEGVEPLESYVVDDGWNNYYDGKYTGASTDAGSGTPNQTGFWEFNSKFPNELYTSSALSDKFQSSFGLWVGPQGGYNYFGTFAKFLEESGTGYAQKDYWENVCVGSKKYVNNLQTMFVDYQKRFNIDYWKWDGFAVRPCTNASHDHMTGGENNMYYTSDLWEKWTDLFDTVRAERAKEGKGLWINATCYVNLSPWLLQWVNTIWVQDSGDTGVLGTGERHEQKIYYRDQVYYQLYKQNQIQFPMKNIYNHDPIYGVSDGSNATTDVFREYLMANAVRGTAFWELYYSPSLMDEAKWKVSADVLDFAQSNHEILKNAKLFGNQPSEGVYGYSSWNGTQGIVSFTNPLDTQQEYSLTIDSEVGAVSDLSNSSVVQVEPYTTGMMADKVSYGDSFNVTLAPHETKIFQFGKVDSDAPEVVSAKVTGDKEVSVKFSERVSNEAEYSVNGKAATAELKEDYRTVVLTADSAFDKDAKVTITSDEVKDIYGNRVSVNETTTAYEDGVVASVEGDKMDPTTGEYYTEITGEKEISKVGISGTNDFGISFNIKTTDTNKAVLTQGNDIKVSIDEDGYLVAKIGSQSVTSKETVTTVKEKAHGLFNTDAYVPTTTENTDQGKVADGEMHSIVITREANGMIKLYENGALRTSAYDDGKKDDIKDAKIVLGSNSFNAILGDVQVVNEAIDYDVAKANADKVGTVDEMRALDREGWTATACSEMEATTGDANAMAAIDGDLNSWWHSNYLGEDKHEGSNHWIAIDFGKEKTFSAFELTGRGGSNGDVSQYNLYAKQNGEWVKIVDNGEFSASSVVNTVTFDEITATGVKLEYVKSNGNFAAAKEINVLAKASLVNHEAVVKVAEDVKKVEEGTYSKASYKAYLSAFNKLQDLVEATKDADTTNFVLQNILNEIESAQASLVDTAPLQVAIDKLKEEVKKTDIYSADSIDEANKLIASVEGLVEDGSKTEIEEALAELNDFKLTVKGDVTSLKALIVDCESKNASDYTEKTWNDLKDVLTEASKIVDDKNVTDAMIETAIASINESKDALAAVKPIDDAVKAYEAKLSDDSFTPASITAAKEVFNKLAIADVKKNGTKDDVASIVNEINSIAFTEKANKDALNATIADAQKKIDSENYTEASKAELSEAIKAVANLVKDDNATQKDVDQAVADLNKVTLVDITDLKAEMEKFNTKMGSDALLPDSQKVAQKVYDNAKALQKDGNAQDIQKAIDAMKNFKFEYKSDKSTLETTINAGSSLKKDDYTKESWDTYQKALDNANKVLKNENATSDEVVKALDQLLSARGDLKKVEPVQKPSNTTKPDTGDHTNTGILFGGLLMGGAALAILLKKRKDAAVK
ncbi:discoidin domain-containing protein [[Eubacterium] hominis]|uniref:discoidin domain-containing protein n=1 Tax=[Eubacterium] hominis TaxID=2764325 RepID=UPI003A4E3FB6